MNLLLAIHEALGGQPIQSIVIYPHEDKCKPNLYFLAGATAEQTTHIGAGTERRELLEPLEIPQNLLGTPLSADQGGPLISYDTLCWDGREAERPAFRVWSQEWIAEHTGRNCHRGFTIRCIPRNPQEGQSLELEHLYMD
jgi:hypothetical protein